MARHHARLRKDAGARTVQAGPPSKETGPSGTPTKGESGDILYGARAIARFIFGDDSDKARRRVFSLWTHYRDRKEAAGFLKLNGAVCLSKSKWRSFHGLG